MPTLSAHCICLNKSSLVLYFTWQHRLRPRKAVPGADSPGGWGGMTKRSITPAALYGMVAGLVATLVMHFFASLTMLLMGHPLTYMFAFIGRVASSSVSPFGIQLSGFVMWGSIAYYLLGIMFGALFCSVVPALRWLKLHTLFKSILAGILYM